MKIFIDTNIFLDFYRSNNDTLKLLDIIDEYFDSIILTEQVIIEFARSREAVIRDVKKSFLSESSLQQFSSSFLHSFPEFKSLITLKEEYNRQQKEVKEIIDKAIIFQGEDPVARFFNRFVNHCNSNDSILHTTHEIYNRAYSRKMIGNPPSSNNKYTIGDEVNWETILANVRDNLIIVGRDNAYQDNINFLSFNFHQITGKQIVTLTGKISDALQLIGAPESPELKAAEQRMVEELKHFNDYWRIYTDRSKIVPAEQSTTTS